MITILIFVALTIVALVRGWRVGGLMPIIFYVGPFLLFKLHYMNTGMSSSEAQEVKVISLVFFLVGLIALIIMACKTAPRKKARLAELKKKEEAEKEKITN